MNMNEIDDQLKRALRRCEPPEGFAERVMARLNQEPSFAARAIRTLWPRPSLRWAAVAAVVAVAATGIGYQIHERQEEAEAKAAKQQVMLALRITGNKLRVAKQRVKAVETGTQKVENTL
jgi:hypothetical protein